MWSLGLLFTLYSIHGVTPVNQVLEAPRDTAQLEGLPVQLNCTVDSLDKEALEWYEYVSSSSAKRIYTTAVTSKIDSSLYEIRGSYNLLIKRVSMQSAGRYECRLYMKEEVYPAELTVLSKLRCDPDYNRSPPQEGIEGQTATLVCSAAFNTSKPAHTQPVMQWRRLGNPVKTTNQSLEAKAVYTSSFNATARDDNVEFTCDLAIQRSEGSRANPSPYTDSCRSRFLVKHSPRNIQIYPDPSNWPDGTYMQLYVGDVINCTASARPTPRYFWRKLAGDAKDAVVTGNKLLILPEHATSLNKYACVAQSQDSLTEASREVEFTAINIGGRTSAGGRPGLSTDVLFPLGLLHILVFLYKSFL